MTPGLLTMQHGALSGRNTTTLTARLMNDLQKTNGPLALYDVAKAFPSVPRMMITDIIKEAGATEPITRLLTEIYSHSPAVLRLHGRDQPIHPKQGMKEGCLLSPTLFLLYYDVLPRETMSRQPDAQVYVFVDDIAVRATKQAALLNTLNHLHHVAHRMGFRFNADKTETYQWARNYNRGTVMCQGQQLTIRPPILTYLGHILAHTSYEDHTWDMVTNKRWHDLAAYKTLPLNGFENVAIKIAVLIPRWTHRGLFLGNIQRMAQWDDILLQSSGKLPE